MESFHEVTRIAHPDDNVVIVLKDLCLGKTLSREDSPDIHLKYSALEGHRIAHAAIKKGETLRSWDLPFGIALKDIEPGEGIFNQAVIDDLSKRSLNIKIPSTPNFENTVQEFNLEDGRFEVSDQVIRFNHEKKFLGFKRGQNRGAGTRNYVVVLGSSSRVTPFLKLLQNSIANDHKPIANRFDGVVVVHHSEGGNKNRDNNHELVLRTLAGWIVHCNVSGILIVDQGNEPVNNQSLLEYLSDNKYPALEKNQLHCLSIEGRPIAQSMSKARAAIDVLVERASEEHRSLCSLSHLKVALQCGGSDAFSGMSGNPLAGSMAKELLQYGGSANLAETSELIGAESYVLRKVKSRKTAEDFLNMIQRFQDMASWHGHSAEGNPSGGNIYRGLYNITIKSIGAANKKHLDVRLDEVIDYGERMNHSGFYFMDSAGNDLESIAGQVASGCNLVLFITGNGSITNFPFVPTLKIVTTTSRYDHLKEDMDINAGRYLDGVSMEQLSQECFELFINTAEGKRSVGELAGHSQAQIWRHWHMNSKDELSVALQRPKPDGRAISQSYFSEWIANGTHKEFQPKTNGIDKKLLIVPTSLCSSQVAVECAKAVNAAHSDERCVAIAHTEGCGVSRGPSEELYVRTMSNYALHPMVSRAVFLEHGCEKTHQSEFQHYLKKSGVDTNQFHWTSIQGSGGLTVVRDELQAWASAENSNIEIYSTPIVAAMTQSADKVFTTFLISIIENAKEGMLSVVIPEQDPSLDQLLKMGYLQSVPLPSLSYGEKVQAQGFHIMETQTQDDFEITTGLGATGVTHFISNSQSIQPPPLSLHYIWDYKKETLIGGENTNQFIRPFQITRGHQGFSL